MVVVSYRAHLIVNTINYLFGHLRLMVLFHCNYLHVKSVQDYTKEKRLFSIVKNSVSESVTAVPKVGSDMMKIEQLAKL